MHEKPSQTKMCKVKENMTQVTSLFSLMDSENYFSLNTNLKYVTLDHKTCPEGLLYLSRFILDLKLNK